MATLKSFVRKADSLFIKNVRSFDGMEDCVTDNENAEYYAVSKQEAIGINGVYCVGGSRDYFQYYEDSKYVGIYVFNCCGSSIIATEKN